MAEKSGKNDSTRRGDAGERGPNWQAWSEDVTPTAQDIVAGLQTFAAIGTCWIDRTELGNLVDRRQRASLLRVFKQLDDMRREQQKAAEDLALAQFRDELAALIPTASKLALVRDLRGFGLVPPETAAPANVHFDDIWLGLAGRELQRRLDANEGSAAQRAGWQQLANRIAGCEIVEFDLALGVGRFARRPIVAGSGGRPGESRATVAAGWRSSTLIKWAQGVKHGPADLWENPRNFEVFDPLAGAIVSGVANVRQLCPWRSGFVCAEADARALADQVGDQHWAKRDTAIFTPQRFATAVVLKIAATCQQFDVGAPAALAAAAKGFDHLVDSYACMAFHRRLARALQDIRHPDVGGLAGVDVGNYFGAVQAKSHGPVVEDRATAARRLLANAAARPGDAQPLGDESEVGEAHPLWAGAARGADPLELERGRR